MDSPAGHRPPRVFVCYRREETSGHAGRLSDSLVEHFGRNNVFMDIDTIRPGEDFVQAIESAVRRMDVVVAVIGPDWLTTTRPGESRRRIDDPNDYIRIEIGEALKRNKTVIPVLVRGAEMPKRDDLPDDIAPLATRQDVELRDTRWFDDVKRLVEAMQPPRASRSTGERARGAPPKASGERSRYARAALVAASVLALVGALVLLWARGDDDDRQKDSKPTTAGTVRADLGGTPQDAFVEADGSVWVVTTGGQGPALVHLNDALSEDRRAGFTGIPIQVLARDEFVWVLTRDPGGLLRFDESLEEERFEIGGVPERAFFSADALWVLVPVRGLVFRIPRDADDVDLQPIEIGGEPNLGILASQKLWIADAGEATIWPIDPPDNVLDPVDLNGSSAVTLLPHDTWPLLSTVDGRVLRILPSEAGFVIKVIAEIPGEGPVRLVSAEETVWAWRRGAADLWAVDPHGAAPPVPHDAPFPLEKVATVGRSLWTISRDGEVVRLDLGDADVIEALGSIEERPTLLVKYEPRDRVIVIAEDGTVYRLTP